MSKLRFDTLERASSKRPVSVTYPGKPADIFATKVFDKAKMYRYLTADTYAKMVAVMDGESPLDPDIVNEVADGMKRWALDNGVTLCRCLLWRVSFPAGL